MIVSSIENVGRYAELHPLFETLFSYFWDNDLENMSSGKVSLLDDDLVIFKKDVICKSSREQQYEAHRKYIDVHYLLAGTEIIGWKNLSELSNMAKPYDVDSDSVIFADSISNLILLHPGDIVICFPEDAHAPEIGNGYIRKVVAKIKI